MTREISFDVEVPGTPDEVWEAIATSRGISGWFAPTEISGDAMTQHHGNGFDLTSRITATERPARFAYEEEFQPGADAEPAVVATEFSVSARSGGTCVVRVVQSGFGTGDAWERAIESFMTGWPSALDDLRLYRTHFGGEPVAAFATGARLDAPREGAWPALKAALGLPAQLAVGDRIQTQGTPPYGGTVARVDDGSVSLVLDAPWRGLGYLGAGGPTGETFAFVRARLFGDGASTVAAREEAAWENWLANAPATA